MKNSFLSSALPLLALATACGGETPPPAPPAPAASASTTMAATATPVASTSAAPAEAPIAKPKVTFAAVDFKEGTAIDFTKSSRRQSVPMKDGKPGTATVTEKMIGGSILVKEVDDKKLPKTVEVTFASGSNEAPGIPSKDPSKDAAFYAGKKFVVKRNDKMSLDVTDDKGKPAFSNAAQISFITSIVTQMVPVQGAFGMGHGLAAKLAGRSIEIGQRTDDLVSLLPLPVFQKTRVMTLAGEKDGVATFDVRAESEDKNETKRADGTTATSTSNRQTESTVQVPLATSLWSAVKYKNSSQYESKPAKGGAFASTWDEDITISRTVK